MLRILWPLLTLVCCGCSALGHREDDMTIHSPGNGGLVGEIVTLMGLQHHAVHSSWFVLACVCLAIPALLVVVVRLGARISWPDQAVSAATAAATSTETTVEASEPEVVETTVEAPEPQVVETAEATEAEVVSGPARPKPRKVKQKRRKRRS